MNTDFGNRLKTVREENSLKREDIAKKMIYRLEVLQKVNPAYKDHIL